jgi:hypothetical protein
MYGSQAVKVHDIILALKIQKMDVPIFWQKAATTNDFQK